MPRSEILVHSTADERPRRLAPDRSVLASSAGRAWPGIAAERQDLPPAESNGYLRGHLLSVQLRPPPVLHAWHGGREQRIGLQPGDVLIVPAGEPMRLAWGTPSAVVNILLDPGPAIPSLRFRTGPDDVVGGLAQTLIAALRLPYAPVERLFVDGIRDALLAHLGRESQGRMAAQPLTRLELARVDALIDSRLTEVLRVQDLAAAVPMSPSHFSRRFRQATGHSPYSHVLRRRVEAAQRLLVREPVSLDEAARRTGFSDASHLTRHFRRLTAMTPGTFRRIARER